MDVEYNVEYNYLLLYFLSNISSKLNINFSERLVLCNINEVPAKHFLKVICVVFQYKINATFSLVECNASNKYLVNDILENCLQHSR